MSNKTLATKHALNTALVISRTSDDPGRVLTAVRYAALGNQKVVLAQVISTQVNPICDDGLGRGAFARRGSQSQLPIAHSERPALWSEILNRVFLLGNIHIDDIPEIRRAMGARHLFLSCPQLAQEFWQASQRHENDGIFEAPVWVMGRSVSGAVPERIKRILLPLSLRTEFAERLRIASTLAAGSGATLVILNVVTSQEVAYRKACTPWTVKSRLQGFFDELSAAPCSLEISLRDGDPAEAILKFDTQHPHDLVILRSPANARADRPFCGATRRILSEAHCPVLLMRPEGAEKHSPIELLTGEAPPQEVALARTSGEVQ